MNIREFLFYNNLRVRDLAKDVGISRWYLDRIINIGLKPSKMLAERLKGATKGQVPIPEGLHCPRQKKRGHHEN